MRAPPFAAVLICLVGSSAACAQSQTAPPLVSVDDAAPSAPPAPPPVVPRLEEAPTEEPAAVVTELDLEARSAWRIHFSAGGGLIASSSGGTTSGSNEFGGLISIGKPLYEAERHRFYQWVTDTQILIGYSPGTKRAMLVMTPTIGTNFYLGPVFGLEWHVGGGFGAIPSAQSNLGIGVAIEGAISLRVFSDDRRRLKLVASDVAVLGFLTSRVISYSSAAVSIGFETPL